MDIIEALKENTEPLSYMAQELKNELLLVKYDGFRYVLNKQGDWDEDPKGTLMHPGLTYRLRPDYKPTPDIVECKVKDDDVRGLYCIDNKGDFCFFGRSYQRYQKTYFSSFLLDLRTTYH